MRANDPHQLPPCALFQSLKSRRTVAACWNLPGSAPPSPQDRIQEKEITLEGLWRILPAVVRACILLFPVLGEAVRIFLCQGLAQILLAVRSKVVTTWIVWSGPRRPSCTSPRRRAKPRFSGGSPRIALLWAIWGNRCTVCKSCKAA
jgi:hypothetical protein